MAYYDIRPYFGSAVQSQGRVNGYSIVLVLAFGHEEWRYSNDNYDAVLNHLRELKDINPHIKNNPNNKLCLVCGMPLKVHVLCNEHRGHNYNNGRLIPYKPRA